MNKLIVVPLIILFTLMVSLTSFAQEKKSEVRPKVEKELKDVQKKGDEKLEKVEAKVEDKKQLNTICPVSGEAIDDPVIATYSGKSYAVCCKSCLKKFNKNPEKYISKLSDDGKSLKKNN